jgi:hypothetical protein
VWEANLVLENALLREDDRLGSKICDGLVLGHRGLLAQLAFLFLEPHKAKMSASSAGGIKNGLGADKLELEKINS